MLISYYEKLYKETHHRRPQINRVADKWGFMDMLKDLTPERVKEVLDFYFLTQNAHTLQFFLYHYDTLLRSLESKESDVENRRKLREQSQIQVREWNERYGNEPSEVN